MDWIVCGTLNNTKDGVSQKLFYQEFPYYRPLREYVWKMEELKETFPDAKLAMFNAADAILNSEGTVRLFVHAFEGFDEELYTKATICWTDDDIKNCMQDAEIVGGYYKILTLGEMETL